MVMAREKIKFVIDMSNPADKRRLLTQIGAMSGPYEVEIQPKRNTRSLKQNAWYFGCIVHALGEYLRDQDYDITTDEEAHEILKARFLAVSVMSKRTGEVLCRRVRSTTELTTESMADYCERCRIWMADFFGIIVPDPDRSYTSTPSKDGVAA
jgi:hypothetical protein